MHRDRSVTHENGKRHSGQWRDHFSSRSTKSRKESLADRDQQDWSKSLFTSGWKEMIFFLAFVIASAEKWINLSSFSDVFGGKYKLGWFSLQKLLVFHLQLGPTGYLGPKTSKTGKETLIKGGLGVPQIHSFLELNLWRKVSKTDILICRDFHMNDIEKRTPLLTHQNFMRKIFVTLIKSCFFSHFPQNRHSVVL